VIVLPQVRHLFADFQSAKSPKLLDLSQEESEMGFLFFLFQAL